MTHIIFSVIFAYRNPVLPQRLAYLNAKLYFKITYDNMESVDLLHIQRNPLATASFFFTIFF
jgi:hypothetical protein